MSLMGPTRQLLAHLASLPPGLTFDGISEALSLAMATSQLLEGQTSPLGSRQKAAVMGLLSRLLMASQKALEEGRPLLQPSHQAQV